MAINTQKVITGGVAAGLAMGAIELVVNFVLAEQYEAALNALNPDLAANMEGGAFVAFSVASVILYGILIAWTYASMRPRYGAGTKTATMVALQIWCLVTLIAASMTFIGMFTWGLFALGSAITVVELLIGANVAGYLYSEEAPSV